MAIPDTPEPKSQLRARMRQALLASTHDPAAVCSQIDQWLRRQNNIRIIATYSALPGEVDLSNLIQLHPRLLWTFPRVSGENLTFHHVTDPASQLTLGHYNIREPSPLLPEIDPLQIDAFFCPGLAFDSHGTRLGRGKGFYDRILKRSRPDALKIGVCFSFQNVAEIPSEAHDIAMDTLFSA